ncbi:hypothetical protein RJ639_014665 [Escallonia herrerae]|uniref:Hexosyltransferase n=1 Tax=Escallonia herrerae TaxID=1293975 RepID=A0AA89AMG5_9ASTE|nr:hypothetical protein RJ639_014665 [Escallonia herrerae]
MSHRPSSSKPKSFAFTLIFLSLTLLLLTLTFRPNPSRTDIAHFQNESSRDTFDVPKRYPKWYKVVAREIKGNNMKLGFVNMEERVQGIEELPGAVQMVTVQFDRVEKEQKWENVFPEWIDQEERFGPQTCPRIPMPRFEEYRGLDVVVARVPCAEGRPKGEGVRDVFRLQVNLVVANLLVRSGSWKSHGVDRTVYVVFIGQCGPMLEIFKCDDLLWHGGEYWVYRPDLRRLHQKVVMPVGSCQLAPPFAKTGKQTWGIYWSSAQDNLYRPREAYVTILHSSETYVCGAIALAQSIIQTNSTKELVLLADDSISTKSLQGLKAAGWKIKHIERIRSPHAEKDAYNRWNYSKLRIWQLIEYDKLLFIDADLVALKNMDEFFQYPELSAAGNDKSLFNSGVMLVEPSKCMFTILMRKRFTLASYNGGDQGFLNEVFTWWHRWPSKVNHLKVFESPDNPKHEIPEDLYTIHYLGVKPWMCGKEYDCNWDVALHHPFASNSAYRKWWQVYEAMPNNLRPYCALGQPKSSVKSR